MTRKPTIYEALAARLGRAPTHRELIEDVLRILTEAREERSSLTRLGKPVQKGAAG